MKKQYRPVRILVWATALIAALLIAVGAVYEVFTPDFESGEIRIGRPRIGRLEARVEIILIEDFQCEACRFFTQEIFPWIQKEFIDSGRAYCVIVPVAFLEGSEQAGNAVLSVYQAAPERLVDFLHGLANHSQSGSGNAITAEKLIDIARNVEGIDLKKLSRCIKTKCFNHQLQENLEWAQKIMGRDFGTPALYIGGVKVSSLSIKAIESRIRKLESAPP
jgi:protein-disulfide isomerase